MQQYQSIIRTIGSNCLGGRFFHVFNPEEYWGKDPQEKNPTLHPLRLWVSDYGGKLRLGRNEFEILVNKFSISKICCEWRGFAIDYCRRRVNTMDLVYISSPFFNGVEVKDNVLVRPTTVTISRSHDRVRGIQIFGSADRLTSLIDGVFGNSVERIVFRIDCGSDRTLLPWWPHTKLTRSLIG